MMTNEQWYEVVNSDIELTQGDIILDCPVIRWNSKPIKLELGQETDILKSSIEVIQADVLVMTQACDLEQHKVNNVILCPHVSLDEYKKEWEMVMKSMKQTPSTKAWRRICKDIKNGYIWNLAMLNEGGHGTLILTHRVVDFHDVYTIPRIFLESLLQEKKQDRLRLCPPYREHLSQAFARFFMRVGLPMGVKDVW